MCEQCGMALHELQGERMDGERVAVKGIVRVAGEGVVRAAGQKVVAAAG